MKRTASAAWEGGLKTGKGTISTESGMLRHAPYGFNTRFEQAAGTNPEELIAAAHAGCFTMAVAAQLDEAGMQANNLHTSATVTLDRKPDGFVIAAVHLDLEAEIPGADQQAFEAAVDKAKTGCPVSKVLNAAISLTVKLVA
jgi:osmotically inducible protein OsmC